MEKTIVARDPGPEALLKSFSIPFVEGVHHLYVGTVSQTQGWILHIAVLPSDLMSLLDIILPELWLQKAAFKVIRTEELHYQLNQGLFGLSRIGKAITIYADSETAAVHLTNRLLILTQGFEGPRVRTDIELGSILFARYGSFKPFRHADGQGYPDNYVYDGKGRLISDEHHIPYQLPQGIEPPFRVWKPAAKVILPYRRLGEHYLLLKKMGDSYRGQTWKALYLKGMTGKVCLIRQGLRQVQSDPWGRSIKERYEWHLRLTERLLEAIPIPRVYDCFSENEDTWLVTECLKGRFLEPACRHWKAENAYGALTPFRKGRILDYLLQVGGILKTLHSLGYQLPEVSDGGWWVTPSGKVYLTRLETIHSIPGYGSRDEPFPPFPPLSGAWAGSFPFPGEKANEAASYAVLCIQCLTGMHPSSITVQSPQRLEQCLQLLLDDPELSEALAYPADLENLSHLLKVRASICGGHHPQLVETRTIPVPKIFERPQSLPAAVQEGLHTLAMDALSAGRRWFSNPSRADGSLKGWPYLAYYNGLHQGTSGILCLLEQAARCGFDVHGSEALARKGLTFLCTPSRDTISITPPGLHFGSAGYALGLTAALQRGYLPKEAGYLDVIRFCLERENTGTDMLSGMAGQGIALLGCAPFLEDPFYTERLHFYARALIKGQLPDGAWVEKQYSFGKGVAGICYFLLEYGTRFAQTGALQAAEKGLRALAKVNLPNKGGWYEGNPGLALTFLHAYACLDNHRYRRQAERILRHIPPTFFSADLSLHTGLSGLGGIYLQAFRILGDETWQIRADRIARLLLHMGRSDEKGLYYWQAQPPAPPTADFMVGSSGVLYFLLRYLHPEEKGLWAI